MLHYLCVTNAPTMAPLVASLITQRGQSFLAVLRSTGCYVLSKRHAPLAGRPPQVGRAPRAAAGARGQHGPGQQLHQGGAGAPALPGAGSRVAGALGSRCLLRRPCWRHTGSTELSKTQLVFPRAQGAPNSLEFRIFTQEKGAHAARHCTLTLYPPEPILRVWLQSSGGSQSSMQAVNAGCLVISVTSECCRRQGYQPLARHPALRGLRPGQLRVRDPKGEQRQDGGCHGAPTEALAGVHGRGCRACRPNVYPGMHALVPACVCGCPSGSCVFSHSASK